MNRPSKLRVFISYTDIDRHGKQFAAQLKKQLEQAGYDVFFFDHSAKNHLGRPLSDVLAQEIDNREMIIVVCTEAISASYGADFEYNHALSREKLVVPLKYDESTVPSPLTSRVHDSFDDRSSTDKFDSIAQTLLSSYQEHLRDQKRRQEIKAKLQTLPKVEPKPIQPSSRGLKLLQSIKKAYNETSLVQNLSIVENYEPSIHAQLTFGQICLRVPILSSLIEETNRFLLVDDIGRSIAFGERRHLQDVWSKQVQVNRFSKGEFNSEGFQRLVLKLSAGINPTILLAPIERYVEVNSWWMHGRTTGMRWELGRSYLVLEDGREFRLFWSNKHAPLDYFVLVDASATRWVVKPDPAMSGRLTTMFVENERDSAKIDFLVKTVVSADLINANGIKAFSFE
jgi:hypothetical protein